MNLGLKTGVPGYLCLDFSPTQSANITANGLLSGNLTHIFLVEKLNTARFTGHQLKLHFASVIQNRRLSQFEAQKSAEGR